MAGATADSTPEAARSDPPTTRTVAAALMTAVVALHMALIAVGNITDFGTNREFVRHVLAMDTTFEDPDLMWRAITSRALQDTAYVLIIVWETAAALLLIVASGCWARVLLRRGGQARARQLGDVGLLMVLLLFGGGFLAVGGEWFAMWQSEEWNGLESATRNLLLAAVALFTCHLPSPTCPPCEPTGSGSARGSRRGATG